MVLRPIETEVPSGWGGFITLQRVGQSGEIHDHAVAETHALPGVPGAGAKNNLAENSMREVSLGRRNWIYVGSQRAGPKVAAILPIVESCRRMKISVREFLTAVLPGLADISFSATRRVHARGLGRPQPLAPAIRHALVNLWFVRRIPPN